MPDGWVDLARQVVAERSRRWPSRRDFARASGVGKRVLDDIETGRRDNYSPVTLGRIESALGWEPGEIEARVQGRGPQRPSDRNLRRIVDAWPQLSSDARTILADLAENAASARSSAGRRAP